MGEVIAERAEPYPVVLSIPSSLPARRSARTGTGDGLLQAGHRLGVIALLALLGAAAEAFTGHAFYWPLAAAFGGADLAVCVAILSLSFVRPGEPLRREAAGVLLFNGVVAVAATAFMLVARAGVVQDDVRQAGQSVRAEVTAFFSPPPALPPQ